jgi:hypothetical protein
MTERNDENRPSTIETGQRAEWVEPIVTRLSAGSAEFGTGTIDDGTDYS